MCTRRIANIFVVVVPAALLSSCRGNTPPIPTTPTISMSSTPGGVPPPKSGEPCPITPCDSDLQIVSMGLQDIEASASGEWLYEARVYLHERGGANVTVTKVQLQVASGSNVLANSRVDRFVSIPANSTVDTAFAVASSLHVAVSDLKADLTVDFRDAEGTPHSVSASFSGFGYWDY